MVRLLSWIVGLPLAIVVVVFALSNRQTASVAFWPFEDGLAMPLYLAVLLPMLIGFLAGFLIAATRGLRHRREARLQAKRAAALERELQALRTTQQPNPTPVPPSGELILPS